MSLRLIKVIPIIFSFASFEICLGSLVLSSKGMDTPSCCTHAAESCQSLNYVLQECIIKNRTRVTKINIFIDRDGFISGKDNIILPYMYNINITSKYEMSKAVLRCYTKDSMLSLGSIGAGKPNVNFHSVKFQNCGPLAPSALLIFGPMNVGITNCIFSHNFCSGLNVKDVDLTIDNSIFQYNYANQTNSFSVDFHFGNTSLGGSVGIMFDKGSNCSVDIKSSKFLFSKSFINRDSSLISHDTGKKRLLSNYYASGGGLSVIHAFNSSKNRVKIENCHFEGNKGTYGGGLFLSFIHNTTGNILQVQNCTVVRNSVSQTGGGILFSCWDWAHNNAASFKDCKISQNDAMVGGAMKIIFNSKDPVDTDRSGLVHFEMVRAKISENTAMSGSALRLLLNLPTGRAAPVLPRFVNCTIDKHKPSRNSKEYPGAILSTRLGIEFDGENMLSSNIQGSAIFVSSCAIHVKGKLILMKNKGKQGGAIYLADTSKIILYPDSHLIIKENHADFRGGGLYVEAVTLQETTYPYNPGCFLQYAEAKTSPSKWKALTQFYNNSASLKGAAIYVKSLVDCLWDENSPHVNVKTSLRWANKIVYSGNFLLREGQRRILTGIQVDIATDTYDLSAKFPGDLRVAPGEVIFLNISAADQLGNRVYSIPSIKHIIKSKLNSSENNLVFGQQYFVLPPDVDHELNFVMKLPSRKVYTQTANVADQEYLRLSATQSSFLVETDLPIFTETCHPGFQFIGGTCACNSNLSGVERCSMGRYVYLKEGYWGGIINGKFVTSICPRGYCNCQKEQGKNGCLYDSKNPDKLCVEGRENILCGRCKEGLSLGLRSTECRDCSGTGWFLAISMISVLIMTLLIIYFNPNIPSDLRGILFYIQVLPFLFKPNDRVGDIVHLLSGISDLGRPTEYPFSTCAVPDLGNLGTTTLNYVTPAEVLIVLIFIFILRRKINLTRSRPFQCFLVLMILMYKYLVETSFALIHCVNVGGKTVFFYDGSWECFQGFHLAFLVVAVVVWFFFLFLPIPIIFYIIHKGANTYCRLRVHQPTIDSISEGLRRHQPSGHCSKCGTKVNHKYRSSKEVFVESEELESCSPCPEKVNKACEACANRSKQWWINYVGQERGWWWAVDLMRRQLLVGLYVFIQDWEIKQVVITIACLFIFALHCLAWPYSKKNRWANRIETLYLLALVLLANMQSIKNAAYRHGVSVFILIFTYGFGVVFFVFKAIRFLRKWNLKKKHQSPTNEGTTDIGSANPVSEN